MVLTTKKGALVFNGRDLSGSAVEVENSESATWATEIENGIDLSLLTLTASLNGAIVKNSLSVLDADLAHAADTMAWVVGDTTQGNDGVYQKQGASGAGSWTRVADLPYNVIKLNNTSAGSANAIQASAAVSIPNAAFGSLLILNITETNTGAVTLSVNGETAKPVVTNINAAIVSGYFVSGMAVLCVDDGTSYRLMSYGDASAIQAAAEAAQVSATNSAATTSQAAAASTFLSVRVLDTTGADPATDYEVGDTIDGLTLVAGDEILRATDGGNASDGLWTVQASGGAVRRQYFDTYDAMVGRYISVISGSTYSGQLWRCSSALGGTIDTTSVEFVSALTTSSGRIFMTENLTIYVNSATGNDTTGAGTSSAPFLTLSHARAHALGNYDTRGLYTVTYQCDGTGGGGFTEQVTMVSRLINLTNPANEKFVFAAGSVVTAPTDGICFLALYDAMFTIESTSDNLTFVGGGGTAGIGIAASEGGFVKLSGTVSFNTCPRAFLQTSWFGTIIHEGLYFTGDSYAPWEASGGVIQGDPGFTVYYTGNPTVGRASAWAYRTGIIGLDGVTITPLGTVTGVRYEVGDGSAISANGVESNIFGTLDGKETGGIYIQTTEQSSKGTAKFFADFYHNAGVPTLRASHNISSIVDSGVGLVTLNFTTPFGSANWTPMALGGINTAGTYYCTASLAGKTAGYVQLYFLGIADGVVYDVSNASAAGFGLQ